MVLLIIIHMKNCYFIGKINPTFSDKPHVFMKYLKNLLTNPYLSEIYPMNFQLPTHISPAFFPHVQPIPGGQGRAQQGLGQAAACHGGDAQCAGEVWRRQSEGHGHQGPRGKHGDVPWEKYKSIGKSWKHIWENQFKKEFYMGFDGRSIENSWEDMRKSIMNGDL